VAFLLAFVYQALKPMQDANVALDIKKQILYSLNIRGLDGAEAEAKYAEVVKDEKKAGDNLYYECEIDGQKKYVFPLKGMGLWGGISAFVAVDDDLNTIYGAYFNHESETAGLGALIKEAKFQEQFIGRPVMGPDGNVALTVVKKGASEGETQVDGVTGATLTSKGVGEMVLSGIQQYVNALGGAKPAGGCCKEAEKCCDKPDCTCAEKKLCACKDGSCGDAACNCASDAKCCAREECPCASCEKVAPCAKAEGCEKAEGCGGCPEEAAAQNCKSGSDCCKSGQCDKSGSCGKPGCDGDKACCGQR
jgi:Na+-transporting NADH:ubiquinone oxidoreductase subunit C